MHRIKRGFTLIELLVVVTIIGLIASSALIYVKDVGEIKAKQFTKEKLRSVKESVLHVSNDMYIGGFLNDCGTMPPSASFLVNDVSRAIGGKLQRARIVDLNETNSTSNDIIAMPFLPRPSNFPSKIPFKALYAGYQGVYVEGVEENKERALWDGWNNEINVTADLNISATHADGEKFLLLTSVGSDGRSSEGISYMKEEFDEYKDVNNSKNFYADDINMTYAKEHFMPKSLELSIDLGDSSEANATKVLIYSPMLYFVEDSEDEVCVEKNATHATCGGNDKKYIPFIAHATVEPENNCSWHIGVIEYGLTLLDTNTSSLTINGELYDFNTSKYDLGYASFFHSFSFENNTSTFEAPSYGAHDIGNPFYMFAGEKEIVILEYNPTASQWQFVTSFTQILMPKRHEKIRFER